MTKPVIIALLGRLTQREDSDAVNPSDQRGKFLYAFELGNSGKLGVGAVLRVYADNKRQALDRARRLADFYYDGGDLVRRSVLYYEYPWIDSLRIYLDGDVSALRLKNGWREENTTMREE